MSLNLRQIEVFRAVMVSGSISAAARMLNISQPAVSRMVVYMEDRLHLKLFERRPGKVIPTPEAYRIFEEVDQVHRDVLRVNQVAEDLRFRGIDNIRIACSPSLGHSLMPLAIKMFRERFDAVRVEMEILSRNELIDRVSTGRVDFGVSVLPVDNTSVISRPAATGKLVLICPDGHRLASQQTVTTDDLCGENLIGFGAHTPYGDLLREYLPECPPPLTVVRFVPNACSLVQARAGIAIVDEFAVSGDFFPTVSVRTLRPNVDVTIHELTSRIAVLSSAASHFRTCFRQCANRSLRI